MSTGGGINTVQVDGEYIHITDLDQESLCNYWSKRQRELNDLYEINAKANQGLRGFIIKLLGINLPDKKTVYLGGINSKREAIYD